jgi:hypothetical protein
MKKGWQSDIAAWASENLRMNRGRKPRFALRDGQEHREHAEMTRSALKRRIAERKQRAPLCATELDELIFQEATDLASRRASLTGVKWHIDHMLPLRAETVSGLHVGNNIAVIPASLNIAKGNRLIYTETGDWLR